MTMELLFLGTGTSAGVPMIGCDCAVCTSSDPRDNRTRPSVLVSYPRAGGAGAGDAAAPCRYIIDTAPELRQQVFRQRLQRIDGVLFTHSHADHIFGLDDVRRFNAVMRQPVDIYADAPTLVTLRRVFSYIFEKHTNVNPSFVADLRANEVAVAQPVLLHGAVWTPLRLLHGRLPILGYRVDYPLPEHPRGQVSLAYCTDVSSIPPETYPLLAELDVLVIDALRYRHHPTHLTVDQALQEIAQIRPRQAYFTHIAHDICHAELAAQLPAGVALAYDGLQVDVAAVGRGQADSARKAAPTSS